MTLYPILVEMKKLLGNIRGWLEKAESHAAAKGYDPDVLLQARLAPDMFPLVRQLQNACDNAKFAAAFTTGKEPPVHADTEQTFDEVRRRIADVISYLDTFTPKDFDGTDSRTVRRPRWEGKSMTATDYFVEHAMPNFFFHLAMTYAVLRHNGVDIGKGDYIGPISLR